ncbi:DUF502 domain-containing protein [Tundrisphaera lichenicola]|uniref:DUF502 domain-containing protein n=1 Tax=Tundrisphaera lichenicola TaxID=2029860 RepID=UPI003EBFF3E4
MRYLGRFFLVTLVRGILFLVPVMLVAVLAREGYQFLQRVSQPVARLFPEDRIFGILAEDLISIAAILLVFLIAGLFVGTRSGRRLSDRLERTILYRVPGYIMVRGAMGSFPGLNSETPPEPVLVETDDGWAFALLIERGPPGFCTVFLPDSPTPTSGAVRIVEGKRVQTLDVPMLNLLACLTRSGTGAGALAGRLLSNREVGAGIQGSNDRQVTS